MHNDLSSRSAGSAQQHPVLICLLGNFSLLKTGKPVEVRGGGKTESLLSSLAMRQNYCAPRDALLNMLWPNCELNLAGQSLNSLVYSLRKRLGDGIGGAAPVVYAEGAYRLNVEAGVGVDVKAFDALAAEGQRHAKLGVADVACDCYARALHLYRGDLHAGNDVQAIMERERLRALYLTLLAWVADFHFGAGDYPACLAYAQRLLASDPFREDAHRAVMRCHVRRGERAQALRQYRLCEEILRAEYDASPEPSTCELYDRIRLDPSSV